MRAALPILAMVSAHAVHAQFAIGAYGGASEDRIWQTELVHVGVLGEFRSSLLRTVVFRVNLSYTPEHLDHIESYSMVDEPEEYFWLSSVTDDRMRMFTLAIDLKFPFEHNACVDGYYKGTYLLAGLGFAQRWQTIDHWEQDRHGNVSSTTTDKFISEPMLRGGFGGEWNFKWGGPFVEGMITVSAPGLGPPAIRFPGAAMLSIGYRYSFAKPEPGEEIGY